MNVTTSSRLFDCVASILLVSAVVIAAGMAYRRYRLDESLRSAIAAGDCKAVTRSVEDGADLHVRTAVGSTTVMAAAACGDNRLLRVALGAHVDPDVQRQHDGLSALMMASIDGNADGVRILIGGGADPNRLDAEGRSSLIWAIFNNNSEAADALLDGGADPDIGAHGPHTAMSMAVDNGLLQLAERIQRIRRSARRAEH